VKRDADSLTFNGAMVKPKTKITALMLGLMLPYMAVALPPGGFSFLRSSPSFHGYSIKDAYSDQ